MPVREATDDLEGVSGRDVLFSAQRSSDQLNHFRGKVGEVAESLVLDLALFTIAAPEEVGHVNPSLVAPDSSGYMYRAFSRRHTGIS
jgi:hypothetical protein